MTGFGFDGSRWPIARSGYVPPTVDVDGGCWIIQVRAAEIRATVLGPGTPTEQTGEVWVELPR